jgi:hypothetical protein
MNRLIVIFCTVVAVSCSVAMAATPVDQMDVTTALPTYGSYFPDAAKSAEFLPSQVRQKLNEYLSHEFPANVVLRIEFRTGCEVDPKKAAAAGFNPRVRYSAIYGVSIKQGALQWYEFRIDLDANGNVVGTDNIPRSPERKRFEFLPEARILAVAKAQMTEWSEVRAKYLPKYDAVAWEFTRFTRKFLRGEYHDVLLIDAMTGKVLDRYDYKPLK